MIIILNNCCKNTYISLKKTTLVPKRLICGPEFLDKMTCFDVFYDNLKFIDLFNFKIPNTNYTLYTIIM